MDRIIRVNRIKGGSAYPVGRYLLWLFAYTFRISIGVMIAKYTSIIKFLLIKDEFLRGKGPEVLIYDLLLVSVCFFKCCEKSLDKVHVLLGFVRCFWESQKRIVISIIRWILTSDWWDLGCL